MGFRDRSIVRADLRLGRGAGGGGGVSDLVVFGDRAGP